MTDTHPKQIVIGGLKIVAEASLVFLLVVGVCWGLCNLAEHQANRPIASDADGIFSLPASKAILNGSVELNPNEKEKQTADFAYHFGRELLAERNGRTIRNWSGEDASVEWRFTIGPNANDNEQKPYEVDIRIAAAPQSFGKSFSVSILDLNPDKPLKMAQFTRIIKNIGGVDKWQTVSLGQVELPPGMYRLVVAPEGAIKGGGLIGLMRVELQPVN